MKRKIVLVSMLCIIAIFSVLPTGEEKQITQTFTPSYEQVKATKQRYEQTILTAIENHYEITLAQLKKSIEISDTTPLDFDSAKHLVKYSDQYDIDYSLVLSIIEIESSFRRDLVGTSNDRGLMQIIPSTERWLTSTFGEELGIEYDPSRIFEPEYNLALGIRYLAELDRYYDSEDKNIILSSYNRGPEGLKKYFAMHNTYQTPYSRKVLTNTQKYIALNN